MLDLTQQNKVSPLINKLFVDNLGGLVSLLILGLVDSYFLSFYGESDLAAATYANPFVFTFVALFFGASYAKTVFLSHKYKENKTDLIYYSNYIDRYIIITAIILVALAIYFTKDILLLTGINTNILQQSIDYTVYHLLGFIFCLSNICLGAFLRSKGNVRVLTKTFLLISLLNIGFDPLFIFYFDLGAKGAAIATSLSWFISFFYINYMVFFKLGYSTRSKKTDLSHYTRLLPSAIFNQILNPLTIMITVIFVNDFGVEVISGYGVGFRIEKILVIFSIAIGSSLLIFAGQNHSNVKRQREGLAYSLKLNFFITMLMSCTFLVFSRDIISIFSLSQAAQDVAALYLNIMIICFLFQSTQNVYSYYLNVTNRHNLVLFINTLRSFLILPLCLYLGSENYGFTGLFYGLATHHIIILIITLLFSTKEISYLFKKLIN